MFCIDLFGIIMKINRNPIPEITEKWSGRIMNFGVSIRSDYWKLITHIRASKRSATVERVYFAPRFHRFKAIAVRARRLRQSLFQAAQRHAWVYGGGSAATVRRMPAQDRRRTAAP